MENRIAVLTTSRSEYYQLQSVLEALKKSSFTPQLFISGSHFSRQFGNTERDIDRTGFAICENLPALVEDDSGLGCALSAGLSTQLVASALLRNSTDLLVLAGDRYETLAAAVGATCARVPIAHIHGGEVTEGAFDDACRHAITKLSALHFASTNIYRTRIIQMGEGEDRVFNVGAPFLDQIMRAKLSSEVELARELNQVMVHPIVLVAYHPVTLSDEDDRHICQNILDVIKSQCNTVVLTAPNSDPGREAIYEEMAAFAHSHSGARLYDNLGSQRFLSFMACADLMIGNSSSGIHEAASFRLPVVNVGSRQAGRLRPRNVLDCCSDKESIYKTVQMALSSGFKKQLADLENPFGDGQAGEKIIALLHKFTPFRQKLTGKRFHDGPEVRSALGEWGIGYGL